MIIEEMNRKITNGHNLVEVQYGEHVDQYTYNHAPNDCPEPYFVFQSCDKGKNQFPVCVWDGKGSFVDFITKMFHGER